MQRNCVCRGCLQRASKKTFVYSRSFGRYVPCFGMLSITPQSLYRGSNITLIIIIDLCDKDHRQEQSKDDAKGHCHGFPAPRPVSPRLSRGRHDRRIPSYGMSRTQFNTVECGSASSGNLTSNLMTTRDLWRLACHSWDCVFLLLHYPSYRESFQT